MEHAFTTGLLVFAGGGVLVLWAVWASRKARAHQRAFYAGVRERLERSAPERDSPADLSPRRPRHPRSP